METNEYSIYQGTVRIARINGATPREAWYAAREVVRTMAFADGVQGEQRIYSTAGRPGSIERGIYTAILTRRVS